MLGSHWYLSVQVPTSAGSEVGFAFRHGLEDFLRQLPCTRLMANLRHQHGGGKSTFHLGALSIG